MKGRPAGGFLAAVGAGLAFAIASSPAAADTRAIADGNDVRGPLDIRRATHGHGGSRTVTHSVTTFRRFASSFLRGENAFTFHFDTNARPARFERFVFVFWANGRLRARVANRRGIIGTARVSRPNGRTVKVRVRKSQLDPAGYHWVVASFFSSGFDLAPNQRLAFHDLTPPKIRLLSFPDPSTDASATLTFPVSFRVRDASGVKWRLQRRAVGDAWAIVARGRGSGMKTPLVTGLEGETYAFRVRATDTAGSTRTSRTRPISVPVDDATLNADGAFSSTWNPVSGTGFLETLHVADSIDDEFTYAFNGSYVAWIAVPTATAVTATINVDGAETQVNLGSFTGGPVMVFEMRGLDPSTAHTVSITGDVGLNVDALVFR